MKWVRHQLSGHLVSPLPIGRIMHAYFMQAWSFPAMGPEIIQVRDVPTEDVDVLRARAAARNMSLSSYLRELIHDDTSRPAMTDVLARISTRGSVEAGGEDVRSFIHTGHRG